MSPGTHTTARNSAHCLHPKDVSGRSTVHTRDFVSFILSSNAHCLISGIVCTFHTRA